MSTPIPESEYITGLNDKHAGLTMEALTARHPQDYREVFRQAHGLYPEALSEHCTMLEERYMNAVERANRAESFIQAVIQGATQVFSPPPEASGDE